MSQPVERQHHTIWTPELVQLDLPLAGAGRRFIARFIDNLLVGIAYVLTIGILWVGLLVLTAVSPGFLPDTWWRDDASIGIAILLFLFIVVFMSLGIQVLYFWLCPLWMQGQTIGKKLMGIRLVTHRGGQVSGATCLLRALLDIIDMVLFSGAIGLIMILMTPDEKRIADYAAGTLVLMDNPATRISPLDNPNPQARQ